jgi:hypothetical protein
MPISRHIMASAPLLHPTPRSSCPIGNTSAKMRLRLLSVHDDRMYVIFGGGEWPRLDRATGLGVGATLSQAILLGSRSFERTGPRREVLPFSSRGTEPRQLAQVGLPLNARSTCMLGLSRRSLARIWPSYVAHRFPALPRSLLRRDDNF